MWSPMIGWANWYTPSVDLIKSFEEGDMRRKASLLLVGANDSIDLNGDGVLIPFPTLKSDRIRCSILILTCVNSCPKAGH